MNCLAWVEGDSIEPVGQLLRGPRLRRFQSAALGEHEGELFSSELLFRSRRELKKPAESENKKRFKINYGTR